MDKNKTTIESLFEQDIEVAYWQLRQRAEQAGMTESDFHTAFCKARKNSFIEVDTQSNCKLMIDEPKKHYKTVIKEGVKCSNRLCEAVMWDIQATFDAAGTSTDTIELWEKRLNTSINYNMPLFPRCAKPHISKWRNQKNTWYLGVCASEALHCRSGSDFLTISVEEMED